MSRPESVLVTGAAGFIGARVVEALHLGGATRPRAGVHRWSTAARLGRLPVEIVHCDVTDPRTMAEAIDGVDAVVHCAYGSGGVTVGGTRNVLAAAERAGVRRVVHLSTIDVYGRSEGRFQESAELRGGFGEYGESKIEAERICRTYAERGVEVVILRPTLVYGPFSKEWTIRYARLMATGRWRLPRGYGTGVCNLVYVDDLVRAILLALEADGVSGEAFNVTGPELPTWRQYLQGLQEATGLPGFTLTSERAFRLKAAATAPVRAGAHFALDHLGPLVKAVYRSSRLARRAMEGAETTLRTTGTPDELEFYRRRSLYPLDKAREGLGYEPRVTMDEGIRTSVLWLRHHGYLDRGLRG